MNRIILACKQNGHSRQLVAQFNAVISSDVVPRENDYKELIFACSRKADPIGANFWFDRLHDEDFVPSAVCYESVIQSFAKRRQPGDLSHCDKWIETMRQKEFMPNVQTMNILLSAHIKTAQKREVVTLFNKMLIKDVVSYTSMIEYYLGVCHDEPAAFKLLNEMVNLDVQPNVRTYNAFLNFCARRDNVAAADIWFDRIENEELVPDSTTFSCIVSAHLRLGDFETVNRYLGKMNVYKIAPEVNMVNKLIDVYALAADFDGAVNLFDQYFGGYSLNSASSSSSSPSNSTSSGSSPSTAPATGLMPDIKSYNGVIMAALRSGNGSVVMKWLETAESHGLKADEALYTAIINWYAQQGEQDLARVWFDRMVESGIQPESSVLNAMVSKIGRAPTTWTRTGGAKNDKIQQRVKQIHGGDVGDQFHEDFDDMEQSA